jgi:hypothetical protein
MSSDLRDRLENLAAHAPVTTGSANTEEDDGYTIAETRCAGCAR